MKYFTKLKLSGYKSIKDVSFTLQPGVNIFIGPNGSGKSNLFHFIDSFNDFYPQLEDDYEVEIELISPTHKSRRIVKREKHKSENFGQWDDLSEDEVESIAHHELDLICDDKLVSSFFSDFRLNNLNILDSLKKETIEKDIIDLYFQIVRYIRFEPFRGHDLFLKYPSSSKEEITKYKWHVLMRRYVYSTLKAVQDSNDRTESLTSLFSFILSKNISDFVNVLADKSPIKGIRARDFMVFEEYEDDLIVRNLQFEFLVQGNWYEWSDLSDGTRRIFQLIYYTYHSNEIVLIEEPELGIHPHQLDLLCEFLKEQAEEKQILISSHSPEVLDRLANKELTNINLVSMKKGATKVKKLTPKQREKAKHYLEEESFLSDYWKYSDLEK